ncbi:MAG: (2Fe-2S)-binding protein [Deltaproteobacteria bacterium]|nr:(2Fe-2S)-binding protein [Deltaproteobacteria bacterium]
MVKIKIDDKEIDVPQGTTVLQAAKANKIDIPYFCYHSKLSIAGNCRMCLVQIKGQNKPVISCREQVREGLEVDTKSPEVKKMQRGVLEFILVNHPLDCPICDQSGECVLQDNYFKYSKSSSRLEDQKIHKPKVKPLGPLVTLDDERCIVCTRCVRFCDEVAKTHELCVTQRGGHSELTTFPGKR